MFDVYGDEIVLDGHTVGRLELPTGSLRDRALDLIESAGPDMVSEKDHAAAIEEAREESYAYGKESGRDEGFEEGRADAFVGMARARDAKRVEALLAAVSETHDALEKIARQRYPAAKIGELKRQAMATCGVLRQAVNAFQAPNGSDENISADGPASGTENPGLDSYNDRE